MNEGWSLSGTLAIRDPFRQKIHNQTRQRHPFTLSKRSALASQRLRPPTFSVDDAISQWLKACLTGIYVKMSNLQSAA
jgi:hypothetical protein